MTFATILLRKIGAYRCNSDAFHFVEAMAMFKYVKNIYIQVKVCLIFLWIHLPLKNDCIVFALLLSSRTIFFKQSHCTKGYFEMPYLNNLVLSFLMVEYIASINKIYVFRLLFALMDVFFNEISSNNNCRFYCPLLKFWMPTFVNGSFYTE